MKCLRISTQFKPFQFIKNKKFIDEVLEGYNLSFSVGLWKGKPETTINLEFFSNEKQKGLLEKMSILGLYFLEANKQETISIFYENKTKRFYDIVDDPRKLINKIKNKKGRI